MKIKIGDQIEDFTLPTAEGKKFSMSQTRGQKVLLTFYRVAGCTFCNMRLIEIKRRFSELGDNFTHVGIFHAPVDALKSTWEGPTNLREDINDIDANDTEFEQPHWMTRSK